MGLRTFLGLKKKPAPEPEPASAIAARRDADQIASLYKDRLYLDAYAERTNLRVAENPRNAIGGMWEEVGKLQFDYLVGKGLKPYHRLLDIGCGTLRGGRLFIRYLDVGGYTGLELSPAALDYARSLVRTENLSDKRPRLVLNKEKDLRFSPFSGETFDFLLAQSVFTHLLPEHIAECFEHVGRIMHRNSVFFFTFREAEKSTPRTEKDFDYPYSIFTELAAKNRLVLDRMFDYPHPRGQSMVRATVA